MQNTRVWQSVRLLASSVLAEDARNGSAQLLASSMLAEDARNGSAQLLASSVLAGDATIVVHNYWQVVCWWKMREWKCAAIGKQCASRKCNNGGAWLLVSSVLVEDAIMEVHGLLSTGATSRKSEPK